MTRRENEQTLPQLFWWTCRQRRLTQVLLWGEQQILIMVYLHGWGHDINWNMTIYHIIFCSQRREHWSHQWGRYPLRGRYVSPNRQHLGATIYQPMVQTINRLLCGNKGLRQFRIVLFTPIRMQFIPVFANFNGVCLSGSLNSSQQALPELVDSAELSDSSDTVAEKADADSTIRWASVAFYGWCVLSVALSLNMLLCCGQGHGNWGRPAGRSSSCNRYVDSGWQHPILVKHILVNILSMIFHFGQSYVVQGIVPTTQHGKWL